MSIDTTGWSKSKITKHAILSRAFEKFEGAKAILIIQWRTAAERHQHDRDALIAAQAFDIQNDGQPQAVRALNLLCEREGLVGAFQYNNKPEQADAIASDDMMLDIQEKDAESFFDEMEEMSRVKRTLKMS